MGRLMVGGSGSGRVAEGLGLGWVVGAKRQGWGRMGQDGAGFELQAAQGVG